VVGGGGDRLRRRYHQPRRPATDIELLRLLVVAAGAGQLALAAASLAIPRVLGWREETARLSPLTRRVFWTYAGYILGFHVAFGLLSTLRPGLLLDGSPLATGVCAFIAVYWGARLVIQFAWFRRAHVPSSLRDRLAEAALVALFVALTLIYGAAAWFGGAAGG
jgi:hypothetical protein